MDRVWLGGRGQAGRGFGCPAGETGSQTRLTRLVLGVKLTRRRVLAILTGAGRMGRPRRAYPALADFQRRGPPGRCALGGPARAPAAKACPQLRPVKDVVPEHE